MMTSIPLSAGLGAVLAPSLAQAGESDIRAVLQRYAAAWSKGDLAEIVGCYHDDFTLHYFGKNALSGDHIGKPRALEVLKQFSLRTQRRLVGITAILVGAERGAVMAREALVKGRDTVEVERLLVYAVRDGLLVECWVYDEDQRLIDEIIG